MESFPATTVRVTSIEPAGDTKVRIMMEMIADVNRLAEVGGDLLHAAIAHVRAEHGGDAKE
jgi:hypothetical protein